MLTILLILIWELRYPQEGLTEKGGVLEVVLPMRGANDLPWGKKCFPGGPGLGRNYTD